MSQTHVVGISDCKVAGDPTDIVITYALGSCVGLTLYDPQATVGGLLHVMLPDSGLRARAKEFNPHMYADTGFRSLLDQVLALGADPARLRAKLAGGANMLGQTTVFDIGGRNAAALEGFCRAANIPIEATSLGGTVGRSMELRLGDGSVKVRILGRGEEIL